jgi:serine/threonine-protein kinase
MTETFGPYVVVSEVASGSTGKVYRVRHTELGRDAAVKELSPALRNVPGVLDRLRAEAATLASLDNEHIVKVYDYVEEPDRAWIAEQWVDGASLEQILKTSGKLTPEQAVGVIRGALIGLAYAHDKNMVHRDIAPTNIVADRAGTSMLVDFGLAAPAGATGSLGTPAFISPEAATGQPVVKQSDVYSAGAVLYALLSGTAPFTGDSDAVIAKHATSEAPALNGHGTELAAVVAKALAKNPAARPADGGALLAELEEAATARFGAGWLGKASITGAVATAAAAVTATTGGAAVTAAAPTVIIDTATAGTASGPGIGAATAAPRKIAGMSAKQFVAAAVAAVVVVVGGTVAVVALTGGPSPAEIQAEKDRIAKAKEKKAIAAVASSVPTGEYDVKTEVTKSDDPSTPVGPGDSVTWTLAPNCDGLTCTGKLKSSSGATYSYTWDGTTLQFIRADEPGDYGCVYLDGPQEGDKVPGIEFTSEYSYIYSPVIPERATPDAPVTAFSGSYDREFTFKQVKGECDDDKDKGTYNSTIEFDATKKS